MATVKIENIAEFRTVAAKYGVAVPAKQGRPPAVKLAQAIVAAGDTVSPTDYFDGRTEYKTVIQARNVGKSEYTVTGKRQVVKDGVAQTTKKGDPKMIPFKKTVAIGDVRSFLTESGTEGGGARGRISGEGFAAYLSSLFNGGEIVITSREKVGAAVAVPATESATEPSSDPSEGENTPAAE